FSPHPYAMPPAGRASSVSEIDAERLREYYRMLIDPQRLVLAVVGDVDAARVEELSERYFSGHDSSDPITPSLPDPKTPAEPTLTVGDLEKEQAHIIAGFPLPPLAEVDKPPLDVLHAILSGQGGRLFYELRDRQSLAYSVRARVMLGLDAGAFSITIGTSPDKIEQAVEGIVDQVDILRSTGVTADEVERARRYLIGSHDIGLQRNSARSFQMGLDELYGLGYRRSLEYGARIEGVEIDRIEELIDRHLDPQKMLVSIVKPQAHEVPGDLVENIVENR
ncbi:MAG: M16 family metallopeptidase, partial [Persicimonas sp.]